MLTIHTPKLRKPKVDPHLKSAGERVKAAAKELERLGIADSNGKRIRSDLEDLYVIQGRPPSVTAFIQANRLQGLLRQARRPLDAAFGKPARKILTLVRDNEGSETLFCIIPFTGAMEDARRSLMSFDQEWWLAHSRRAGGRLNFDFDLV